MSNSNNENNGIGVRNNSNHPTHQRLNVQQNNYVRISNQPTSLEDGDGLIFRLQPTTPYKCVKQVSKIYLGIAP